MLTEFGLMLKHLRGATSIRQYQWIRRLQYEATQFFGHLLALCDKSLFQWLGSAHLHLTSINDLVTASLFCPWCFYLSCFYVRDKRLLTSNSTRSNSSHISRHHKLCEPDSASPGLVASCVRKLQLCLLLSANIRAARESRSRTAHIPTSSTTWAVSVTRCKLNGTCIFLGRQWPILFCDWSAFFTTTLVWHNIALGHLLALALVWCDNSAVVQDV